MHLVILLLALVATVVKGQGEGLGYPPPPPILLSTIKSGVLPVIPTETPFAGVETLEGAIVEKAPPNPSFTPLNGPAPTQANTAGATYRAVLPSTNCAEHHQRPFAAHANALLVNNGTGSTVSGSITVAAGTSGTGVDISVNFEGFPDVTLYGPFKYHIHDLPVPADGNCISTLGHLDPQNAGEYYPCPTSSPQNCQVGDLGSKYGSITTSPFVAQYSDPFLSTVAGNPASVSGRSIVIHTSNTTRITCANFVMISGNSTTGSNGTISNGATPPAPTMSAEPSSEAGRVAGYSVAAFLAAVAAFFL
ncbi:hypothetical protein LTR37_010947 [Vermiconidia calcicola]|uniref:Uncharacterized protein n=1 Tax=Vermiconidia calcicola TaxID=1690605 RepID=A0ACC3N590_9PEZI|nr:hypothetical protein LTR37_010947 [Vermiconidia calcicola]